MCGTVTDTFPLRRWWRAGSSVHGRLVRRNVTGTVGHWNWDFWDLVARFRGRGGDDARWRWRRRDRRHDGPRGRRSRGANRSGRSSGWCYWGGRLGCYRRGTGGGRAVGGEARFGGFSVRFGGGRGGFVSARRGGDFVGCKTQFSSRPHNKTTEKLGELREIGEDSNLFDGYIFFVNRCR